MRPIPRGRGRNGRRARTRAGRPSRRDPSSRSARSSAADPRRRRAHAPAARTGTRARTRVRGEHAGADRHAGMCARVAAAVEVGEIPRHEPPTGALRGRDLCTRDGERAGRLPFSLGASDRSRTTAVRRRGLRGRLSVAGARRRGLPPRTTIAAASRPARARAAASTGSASNVASTTPRRCARRARSSGSEATASRSAPRQATPRRSRLPRSIGACAPISTEVCRAAPASRDRVGELAERARVPAPDEHHTPLAARAGERATMKR